MRTDDSKNSGDLEEMVIFILVCINTEDELSYIDRILYECEFKLTAEEYLDQREKQFDMKLNYSGEDEGSQAAEKGEQPLIKLTARFCYSKIKFIESLITDLQALTNKEKEYIEYLDGCMSSINYVIVKTQALIRGWLARRRLNK
jgi:hypothetical protein